MFDRIGAKMSAGLFIGGLLVVAGTGNYWVSGVHLEFLNVYLAQKDLLLLKGRELRPKGLSL